MPSNKFLDAFRRNGLGLLQFFNCVGCSSCTSTVHHFEYSNAFLWTSVFTVVVIVSSHSMRVRRSHFQIISLLVCVCVCVCLACSPNSKRKHFALRLWRVCDRALSLADCLIGIRRSVRGERRGYIPVLVSSIAACSNMRTRMLKVRQTTSASNRYACNALAAPHREPPSKSHTPHTNHTHSIFQIECTFIISVSISFSLSRWLWYARSRVYIVVWCMRRVGVFWKIHAHTRNKHQLNMRRHTAAAHVAQSSQIKRTHTHAHARYIYWLM